MSCVVWLCQGRIFEFQGKSFFLRDGGEQFFQGQDALARQPLARDAVERGDGGAFALQHVDEAVEVDDLLFGQAAFIESKDDLRRGRSVFQRKIRMGRWNRVAK